MSIFSKKQKVNLEDFCSDFYEKYILNPVIEGLDAGAVYHNTVIKSVVEVDQNFANINSQKLGTEMIPLRFELFALAWLHQFGYKSAIPQSVFTKHYLQGKKRDDIWDASESYNQAIARSIKSGKTIENPLDRTYIWHVDKTRVDLFEQYAKNGYDMKCVARVLNRLFSDDAWENGITSVFLMFALCERLGFEQDFAPTEEAGFRLIATIRGLYVGARESLEKIKISN